MSSVILMVVSIDRALVIYNRRMSQILGSLRNFQKNYINKSIKNIFSRIFSNFHTVDLVIMGICGVLLILNGHYLIFLDLNKTKINIGDTLKSIDMDYLYSSSLSDNNYLNNTFNASYYSEFTYTLLKDIENINFNVCFPLEHTFYYFFLNYIWIWIDIAVFCLVPFVIMSISSAIILVIVLKANRSYYERVNSQNFNNNWNGEFYKKRLRRNRQIFSMLLLTNSYFLISLLPYSVSFIYGKNFEFEETYLQLIVHIIMYTNNAFNFIFYGVLSQKYRQELKEILLKFKNRILL